MEQLLYIIFLLFSITTACAVVVQGLKMSDKGSQEDWYNISLDNYSNGLADNQPQVSMENAGGGEHFNKYTRAGLLQNHKRTTQLSPDSSLID